MHLMIALTRVEIERCCWPWLCTCMYVAVLLDDAVMSIVAQCLF